MITEKQIHEAVCRYIRFQYPDVMFNTDMSGIKLTKGQAGQASRLRSNTGFPDLFIPENRGGFGGLFIELKRDKVKLKKSNSAWSNDHIKQQAIVLDKLRQRNFVAAFAVGFDEAKKLVDDYLSLK